MREHGVSGGRVGDVSEVVAEVEAGRGWFGVDPRRLVPLDEASTIAGTPLSFAASQRSRVPSRWMRFIAAAS